MERRAKLARLPRIGDIDRRSCLLRYLRLADVCGNSGLRDLDWQPSLFCCCLTLFAYCLLASVVIPDSVTSIGAYARLLRLRLAGVGGDSELGELDRLWCLPGLPFQAVTNPTGTVAIKPCETVERLACFRC